VTGALARSARSLSPSAEFITYAGLNSPVKWWGAATWGSAALAAFGGVVASRRLPELGAVRALWPLALVALPTASAIVLSLLATPHFVAGRVDQMMLPAYALLVGAGLASLRPAWTSAVLGVALLAVGLLSKHSLYEFYRSDSLAGGERVLAERIAEVWRPGDVVVCTSLSRAPLAYYLGRSALDVPLLSYPRVAGAHLGAQNDEGLLEDRSGLMREAAAVLSQARMAAGGEGRLFVVWVKSRVNYPLRHEALVSQGFEPMGRLGNFRQHGTGLVVEARVYDPP
jgi:hypothetical protein